MGFIRLSEAVSFHHAADGESTLVRLTDGATLSLNRIATMMLSAALKFDTGHLALSALQTTIDANARELSEALHAVIDPLLEGEWIVPIADPVVLRAASLEIVPYSVPIEIVRTTVREGPENRPNTHAPENDRHIHHSSEPSVQLSAWDGNWEIFLTGALHSPPLPTFSRAEQLRAAYSTSALLLQVRCIRLLAQLPGLREKSDAWEWRCIHQALADLHVSREVRAHNLEPSLLARLARRELLIARLLSHLLLPGSLCLERSLACCSYLRALGLPAQIVIGQSCFGKADRFAFHAWVELAGSIVNDLAELKTGYTVLQRIPMEAVKKQEAHPEERDPHRRVFLGAILVAILAALATYEVLIGKQTKKRT